MKKTLIYLAVPLCSGLLMAQSDSQTSSYPAQTSTPVSGVQSTASSSTSNSWTGLLVANGCQSTSSSMNSPGSMSKPGMNTTGAMSGSTPAAANAGAAIGTGSVSGTSSNTTGSDLNRTNSAATGTADRSVASPASSMPSATQHDSTAPGASTASADQNFPRATASAAQGVNGLPASGLPLRTGDMDTVDQGASSTSTTNATMGSADRGWTAARSQAAGLGPACHVGANTTSYSLMLPDGRMIPFDSASNQKIADQIRSRIANSSTKIFRVVVKGTMQGDTISLDMLQI